MEVGVLSLFAGAIVAKAAADVWFSGVLDGATGRSAKPRAEGARGGFLRRLQ
jgi:hypothetical protein